MRTTRNQLIPAEQLIVDERRMRIVTELLNEISETDKGLIKAMSKDDLGQLHHSLGMAIRNEFGLWAPESDVNQIYQLCEIEFPLDKEPMPLGYHVDDHPCHPDNFSFTCIEKLWETLQ